MVSGQKESQIRAGGRESLLLAMYEVCRFLLSEKDLPTLLQGICDRLVTRGAFDSALMVLLDEETGMMITAETGFADRFPAVLEALREGTMPSCGDRVLAAEEKIAVWCDLEQFPVPESDAPGEHPPGLCTAIRCTSSLYGFLLVYRPLRSASGEDTGFAPSLFAQLGEPVAQALRRLFAEEESKHREEEMRLAEERYELALYASQAGLWDWNIQTGEMYTSPNQREYLDYRSGDIGPGASHRVVHPDDKPKVLAILNKHLAGETDEYRIEYRVKDADGEWAWYLDRGRVVERDENKMPVRMTGTHQNITIQKQREQTLAAIQQQLHDAVDHERSFLQTVIDSAGDPVMVVDLQYTLLLMNRTAAELVKNPGGKGSVEGKKCYELFCGADIPCTDSRYPCPIQAIKEKGQQVKLIHNPYHGNGINNTFELDISPLVNSSGELYGVIEVARDVTDRLRIEKELRDSQSRLYRLAHHDTLTGLPNRLLFRDRLDQALIRSERMQKSVAIMFLDLDRFKQINDTLGHDAGDELLVAVAQRLKQQCRASDTVARLGGDEFVYILDGIGNRQDVSGIAEKIIASMQEPVMVGGHRLDISTSMGIALYPDDSSNIDGVIKCADQALYRAKEAGRNTYRFYEVGESR